jgi:WD40 repeat protein
VSEVLNPFPGLRPFGSEEAHLFFGREEHLDDLLGRLRSRRFVAVVGASGSGKSSLVLAGLIPALHGGLPAAGGSAWRVARMRPGVDPIGRLAEALLSPKVWDLEGDLDGDGSDRREWTGGTEGGEDGPDDLDGLWDRDLERDMTAATLRRSRLGLVQAVRESRLGAGENLLVLVDQFEELFRFRRLRSAGVRDEAASFVHLLLEAARQEDVPIHVLITMRADFLGECVQFPGLPEAINRGQYLIPRLDRRRRRAVIEGPVRVGGAEIDPPLLQRLLNDVGDDPDQLPILQHALMRTFDLWLERTGDAGGDRPPIGLADYEAAGTLGQALSRHAEEAFAALDDSGRGIAETLFKSLTEKTADGQGIRRPTTLGEIADVAEADRAEVAAVIEVFRAPGRAFLMPVAGTPLGEDTLVDISHESLMRVWGRLERWTAEEAEAVAFYRRLAQAAELHFAGEAGLWRDPELELALQWRETHRPNPAWAARSGLPFEPVMEFLERSREDRDARRAAAEEARRKEVEQARALAEAQQRRAETERRTATRLRRAMVLISGALVVMVVSAAWALWETHRAEKLSRDSAAAEVAALASSADHWVEADRGFEALQEALFAARQYRQLAQRAGPRPELRKQVEAALVHSLFGLHERNRWQGHAAWPNALEWTPDGEALLSAGYEQVVKSWRPDGTPLPAGAAHRSTIFALAVSPAGGAVASAGGGGTIRIRGGDGEVIDIPDAHEGTAVRSLDFSPSGAILVSGGDDGALRLWGRDGRFRSVTRADWTGRVNAVRFSPSGPLRVAAGGDDGTIEIWRGLGEDSTDGAGEWIREVTFSAHEGGVQALDFLPRGDRLASGGTDGRVVVWSLEGEPLLTEEAHGPVDTVRFSPDGDTLAWSGADRVIHVRRPDGQVLDLVGHSEPVAGIAFSPDGTVLASTARDMSVRLWQLDNPYQTTLEGHGGTVWEVDVDQDGTRIASCSDDNTVRLWTAGGELIHTLEGHRKLVRSVRFAPGGRLLASASHDGTVRVWTLGSSDAEPASVSFEGDPVGVNEVDFGPDGESLVTAGLSGTVGWWSPSGNGGYRKDHELHSGESQVWGVRYGPENGLLWTGADPIVRVQSADGAVAVLEARGGGIVRGTFSPDGTLVAAAMVTGDAFVWRLSRSSGAALETELVARIAGHDRGVNGVAFSPDGRIFATAGLDGVVKLWNTDDWSLLRVLRGHHSSVTYAAFSPRGNFLVSSSSDRTIKIWRLYDLSLDELVTQAEEWLADYRKLSSGSGTAPDDPLP